MSKRIIRASASVCPICLKRIPARQVMEGESLAVWQEKTCPIHGDFRNIIWRGRFPIDSWRGDFPSMDPKDAPNCPNACGLCEEHQQKTCCVVLEVTSKCNLHCKFCFANGGEETEKEPSFEKLCEDIKALAVGGRTLLQLSGGEPTERSDLPQLVRAAKAAGCKYVQLNTNGLRIGRDPKYLHELAEAGLSFVFLQFDGTDDGIYKALRNRPLFLDKCRAIAACSRENIGVTLVSTIVPNVNTHALGDILRFGIKHSPAVRGVHFQPASFFGRIPNAPSDHERYLLDELIYDLSEQSQGLISVGDLTPSCCDHPLCGFHGDFVVLPKGKLMSLGKKGIAKKPSCCCSEEAATKNREFVGRRWQRPAVSRVKVKSSTSNWDSGAIDMEEFIERTKTHGFTVTSMAFQDAGNLDLERLRKCSLHVFKDGRFIPFCSNYLSSWK